MARPPQPVPEAIPADVDLLRNRILDDLAEAKAEGVVALELTGKTSVADAMLIASGRSNTHVAAIADRVLKGCKAVGHGQPRVEGLSNADWVLVDAGTVVVHIFRPEVRAFYNLEKLWGLDRPADQRSA